MVSVLPATVADAVRTVAAAAVWPVAASLADGPPAAAAAVAPPAAVRAARPIPAMMSLGCRMVGSLWGLAGQRWFRSRLLRGGRLPSRVVHCEGTLIIRYPS